MLQMLDVEVGYGRTSVIHGVTIEVPVDGVAAVMGHNGAGKTTLLRAAVGLCSTARTSRGSHRTSGCGAGWRTCRRASSRSGR